MTEELKEVEVPSVLIKYDPSLAEGGELLSTNFWECGCSGTDAIHPEGDAICDICSEKQEESSNADISSVIQFLLEEGITQFFLEPAENW
jgi:hypothetical protein